MYYQNNASFNSTDVSSPDRNIPYYYVLGELLVRNPQVLNSIFGTQDRLTLRFSCYCEAIRSLKWANTFSFPHLTNLPL
jgi:hypothetical protein